jgi:hypothetical protein
MAATRPPNSVAPAGGPRPRILRIGVLLGGKIVEERLIRERTTVSIGQSMKNTFSIPVEGLPLEFPMFVMDQGKYYLRFLTKMDGRLSDGPNVSTLDALKGRGAQNTGEYWQVPLADNARGKLSLGDLTVLFQFVTEPPRQPKPMLPASVRGTLADRFDPRLSVILGASIILHFAIVIIALTMDVEIPDTLADRAYNLTFSQDTYTVDLEKPKPQQQDTQGADQSKKEQEKAKPVVQPKPQPKDTNSGRDDKKDVSLQQQQEAAAMANALTGEGPDGKAEGDMARRRPGSDLAHEIEGVKESGRQVAVGGGAGRGSRDSGDPRVGTGRGPNINASTGTESAGGGKVEHEPTGRIAVSDKTGGEDTTLSPDAVLAKIQSAYMAGLKRCYKEHLKKDPSARGKVTLSLTINETGRTVKGAAHGFANEVDECIGGLMAGWRFPIPKDKDGEATTADFAITLQLVPD